VDKKEDQLSEIESLSNKIIIKFFCQIKLKVDIQRYIRSINYNLLLSFDKLFLTGPIVEK